MTRITPAHAMSASDKTNKKSGALPPERERFMQACADIAHQLIQDHEANDGSKVTNLNTLRGQVSKKHKLSTIPSLTAIMAAIPEHYKKYINWKLVQKPVRMFVCFFFFFQKTKIAILKLVFLRIGGLFQEQAPESPWWPLCASPIGVRILHM
jgi:hypothetical protein